jgi:hypothetical protein
MTISNPEPNPLTPGQQLSAVLLFLVSLAVIFGVLIGSFSLLPLPWGFLGIIPAIWIYSFITGNTIVETIVLLFIGLIIFLLIKPAIDAIKGPDPQNENADPPKAVVAPKE